MIFSGFLNNFAYLCPSIVTIIIPDSCEVRKQQKSCLATAGGIGTNLALISVVPLLLVIVGDGSSGIGSLDSLGSIRTWVMLPRQRMGQSGTRRTEGEKKQSRNHQCMHLLIRTNWQLTMHGFYQSRSIF